MSVNKIIFENYLYNINFDSLGGGYIKINGFFC